MLLSSSNVMDIFDCIFVSLALFGFCFVLFFNLHVSAVMGGNWVRVTAMMMKMIKGQMIRVKDQSCSEK